MVVGFIVAGAFALFFVGIVYACCKVAGDADKQAGRDLWDDLD